MSSIRPDLLLAAAACALAAHALGARPIAAQQQQPAPNAPNAPNAPTLPAGVAAGVRLAPRPGAQPSGMFRIPPIEGVRPGMAVPPAPAPAPRRGRGPARRARRPAPPPPPPPGVELSVTPAPDRGRYLYFVELRATTWESADVLADRRLLRFDVVPAGGGRSLSCASPSAPSFRRAVTRLRTLGGAGSQPWREWLDIREYCWGRALTALDQGARLEPRLGFRRARRGEWVARRAGQGEPAVASVLTAAPLDVAAAPAPAAVTAPIAVSMRRVDVATDARLSFTLSLAATGSAARIYPRPDLYRFVVDGPAGRTECGLDTTPIVPIRDFYRTITRARRASTTIDVRIACPDVFREGGVYDVTPIADLPYDGARFELEVVTGTFVGATTPVRIRVGAHPDADHSPATLPPAPPAPPADSAARRSEPAS